jgi:DNA-directed RNA polymerase subunit omega
MLKPSVELTQNQTISDYSLVVGIAKKAREIASDAETKGTILEEKPVDLAVQQYIEKKFHILEPTICEDCGHLDCICEKPAEEETCQDSGEEACACCQGEEEAQQDALEEEVTEEQPEPSEEE